MKYDEYIRIHELLALQNGVLEAGNKDEALFIVVHQTSELLLKVLHMEFDALESNPSPAAENIIDCFCKANVILTLLIGQVHLCQHLPREVFFEIREKVFPASAYESEQFQYLFRRIGCSKDDVSSPLWEKISEVLEMATNRQGRDAALEALAAFKKLIQDWQQEHIKLAYYFLGETPGAQSDGGAFLKERCKVEVFPSLGKYS